GQIYQLPAGPSAYLPVKENGKVLVVGSAECVQDVVQLDGAAPPVQRAFEKLLLTTDDRRVATLLWLPATLNFADDRPPNAGVPWRSLMRSAHSFLGDAIRAAALNVQLADDNLFLELVVQGPLGTATETVGRRLQDRLAKMPGNMDHYLASLSLQSYDKSV